MDDSKTQLSIPLTVDSTTVFGMVFYFNFFFSIKNLYICNINYYNMLYDEIVKQYTKMKRLKQTTTQFKFGKYEIDLYLVLDELKINCYNGFVTNSTTFSKKELKFLNE